MTPPQPEPRRRLHRAAAILRESAHDGARGPWRWADPDPDVLANEGDAPPTSVKDLPGPAHRMPPPAVPDPLAVFDEIVAPAHPAYRSAAHADPATADALATLLEIAARQMEHPAGADADVLRRCALTVADRVIEADGRRRGSDQGR